LFVCGLFVVLSSFLFCGCVWFLFCLRFRWLCWACGGVGWCFCLGICVSIGHYGMFVGCCVDYYWVIGIIAVMVYGAFIG
ncbi:hypothetical protein VSS92_28965, partial [Pseudomonas syringae pv. tagetis]